MADISHINLQGQTYNIKDTLLRHQINVLLGIEPAENEDVEENSEEE